LHFSHRRAARRHRTRARKQATPHQATPHPTISMGAWGKAAVCRSALLIMWLLVLIREVQAIFTPADRSALQTALFGCVGACGAALDGSGNSTYCETGRTGPWGSGTGADCDEDSTHGAINTWDVSSVTNMNFST
jgi:hypothetical protein